MVLVVNRALKVIKVRVHAKPNYKQWELLSAAVHELPSWQCLDDGENNTVVAFAGSK